jgi:hypothetical protein
MSDQLKSAREWFFEKLPVEVELRAVKNSTLDIDRKIFNDFESALKSCFIWISSPEGHSYWKSTLEFYNK